MSMPIFEEAQKQYSIFAKIQTAHTKGLVRPKNDASSTKNNLDSAKEELFKTLLEFVEVNNIKHEIALQEARAFVNNPKINLEVIIHDYTGIKSRIIAQIASSSSCIKNHIITIKRGIASKHSTIKEVSKIKVQQLV